MKSEDFIQLRLLLGTYVTVPLFSTLYQCIDRPHPDCMS